MELSDLYCLLEEQKIINDLPEAPQEVEEYLGEVLVAIENIIDDICSKIKFNQLPIN